MFLESHIGMKQHKNGSCPKCPEWHQQKVLTYFNHNTMLFLKLIASASRAAVLKRKKKTKTLCFLESMLGKKHPSPSSTCQWFFLPFLYVTVFSVIMNQATPKMHLDLRAVLINSTCHLDGRAAGSEHTFLPMTCIHNETPFSEWKTCFSTMKKRRKYLTVKRI